MQNIETKMIDQYEGWKALFSEIQALSCEFGVHIQTQPKGGYLRLSAPCPAPAELTRRLENIEEQSSVICQFCGLPNATDRERGGWIYTICSNSEWILLIEGGVAASCAFKGASSKATLL